VVLVEVARKAYLGSLVPVIVNAILNEHQIVADIVAFVNKGDFPRSRLGEKQRGKILATWVTSKMRTIAQFGIRDGDGGLTDLSEAVEPRHGSPSMRNSSVVAGSLRNMEANPILEQRELEQQHDSGPFSPTGNMAELPSGPYTDSIPDSTTVRGGSTTKSDDTATEPRAGHFELPTSPDLGSKEKTSLSVASSQIQPNPTTYVDSSALNVPPLVGPKPLSRGAPQLPPLPAVDGREGDLWTLPSQRPQGDFKLQHPATEEDDDWSKEALMHMNLARR